MRSRDFISPWCVHSKATPTASDAYACIIRSSPELQDRPARYMRERWEDA
jgi:hypothetical protein